MTTSSTARIQRLSVPIEDDPRAAVGAFAAQAIEDEPALICAFFDRGTHGDAIVQELQAQLSNHPLVLSSTAGEICRDTGYANDAITGFTLPKSMGYSAAIESLDDLASLTTETASHVVANAIETVGAEPGDPNLFAMTILDGVSRQEERVAFALQNALGTTPLVGGSAGDGLRFEKCLLGVGDASTSGILVLVRSERPFRVLQTQHFIATDRKLVVTDAEPELRRVIELNGAPAAQEYADMLGLSVEDLDPSVFARNPLLVRIAGEHHVRSIQRAEADGSLHIYCAIDEGLVLTLGQGQSMVEDLDSQLTEVYRSIGEPQLTIGFDCILRRLEAEAFDLGDALKQVFERFNVIGFNTYGEQFGSIHVNQTFTGVALA